MACPMIMQWWAFQKKFTGKIEGVWQFRVGFIEFNRKPWPELRWKFILYDIQLKANLLSYFHRVTRSGPIRICTSCTQALNPAAGSLTPTYNSFSTSETTTPRILEAAVIRFTMFPKTHVFPSLVEFTPREPVKAVPCRHFRNWLQNCKTLLSLESTRPVLNLLP